MILGIDPGTTTIGYAFLSGSKNSPVVHDFGVILTQPKISAGKKLVALRKDLEELIAQYQPTCAVVEALFFATNAKTVIEVAQARGVILECLENNQVPVSAYTPLQVKLAITGYGKATKKQIQTMMLKIMQLKKLPKPDDAADALALAWVGLS